jgi:hypothetical protein
MPPGRVARLADAGDTRVGSGGPRLRLRLTPYLLENVTHFVI